MKYPRPRENECVCQELPKGHRGRLTLVVGVIPGIGPFTAYACENHLSNYLAGPWLIAGVDSAPERVCTESDPHAERVI